MRQSDQPLPTPPRNDRPGSNWICGWSDSGNPCQHGPSGSGTCPALSACMPAGDGDEWICNRPACLGGKCEPGPHNDGTCGLKPTPCKPKRTWKNRRRTASILCATIALGITLVSLSGPWRTEAFAPGGLVRPHAQILGGELKSDRCASCHPAARQSLVGWFFEAGDVHNGLTQTQLCMDCHHNTIENSLARNAHNMPLDQLRAVSASLSPTVIPSWQENLPAPAVALNDVACATCHREHHGAENSLSALTSHQCQTCHKQKFDSFTNGHPDWTDWPYGRGSGKIAFNHATHAGKHFPLGNATFECSKCHSQDSTLEMSRSVSFESGCASCHDKPMNLGIAEGFDLVQFPMLDTDALSSMGHSTTSWPENAKGAFDGKIPPVVRLLLRSNPATSQALDSLPPGSDIGRINPKDAQQSAAVAEIALALRQLLDELSTHGRSSVGKRISQSTGVSPEIAGRIAGQLSPQLIASANRVWFADESSVVSLPHQMWPLQIQLAADWQFAPDNPLRVKLAIPDSEPVVRIAATAPNESENPGLNSDLDALDSDVFALPKPKKKKSRPKRFDSDSQLPSGGWFTDSLRLAVQYKPSGHDDEVLMALVELAYSAPKIHPEDRKALLALPAIQACTQCHRDTELGSLASWRSKNQAAKERSFTKFSHRPHMNLPLLSDCQYCHTINDSAAQDGIQTVSLESTRHEFHPLTREACSKCHKPNAAGNACTKCHRYHVESSSSDEARLARLNANLKAKN